jgi:hypothetical protein
MAHLFDGVAGGCGNTVLESVEAYKNLKAIISGTVICNP